MNTTEITTVQTGTRVQYEDMSNPLRTGVVLDIESTPWGVVYGVQFDGINEHSNGETLTTDLRQRGWKFEQVFA